MQIIKDFIFGTGGVNEYPIVRTARLMLIAAALAGITALLQALPGIDFPGDYDPLIVMVGTPIVAGAEKWLRDHNAPATG